VARDDVLEDRHLGAREYAAQDDEAALPEAIGFLPQLRRTGALVRASEKRLIPPFYRGTWAENR
jgi:hypothetical protein